MKKILFVLLPVTLVVAVAALYFGGWIGPKVQPAIRTDSAESILEHVRAAGSPLVLINFWASWCEPCKVELPALKSLQDLYQKDLQVFLVSIDDPADMETAETYLRDHQLEGFPAFYRGAQPLTFVSRIFPNWSGAVPASLLMSPDLKVLDAWEGDTSLEEFKAKVQQQLKGT